MHFCEMVSRKQPMFQPDANYFNRFVHSSGWRKKMATQSSACILKGCHGKMKQQAKVDTESICTDKKKNRGGINGTYLEEWDTLFCMGRNYCFSRKKKINDILQVSSKTTLNLQDQLLCQTLLKETNSIVPSQSPSHRFLKCLLRFDPQTLKDLLPALNLDLTFLNTQPSVPPHMKIGSTQGGDNQSQHVVLNSLLWPCILL